MAEAVPSGVDYSQYPNWEVVKTPSGGLYYRVPGTSWVYDPFLSVQKGRPVLWKNPQPELEEAERQRKQQKKESSVTSQVVPVVASVAGTAGAAYIVNEINSGSAAKPGTSAAPTNPSTKDVFTTSATAPDAPNAGASGTSGAPSATAPEAPNAGAAGGTGTAPVIKPVGSATMSDGSAGVLMTDGSKVGDNGIVELGDGSTINRNTETATDAQGNAILSNEVASYLGYAAALYTAYDTYKNRKNLTSEQEAAGYAQAGVTAYQAYQVGAGAGASGYASALGAAISTAALLSSKATEEEKTQGTRDRIALAFADYYTFGLATPAYNWANTQWGGTMQKMRDIRAKVDPFERFVMPLFDTDAFKTEGDRLKKLQEAGVNIPENLSLPMQLKRGRQKSELIAEEQQKIDAGQYGNVEFAKSRTESNLKPEDIWGNAAFLEKFGNDWLGKFSEGQRRAIAALALQQGAVREHHGTIDVDWDAAGVNDGVAGVVGQNYAAPQTTQGGQVPSTMPTNQPQIIKPIGQPGTQGQSTIAGAQIIKPIGNAGSRGQNIVAQNPQVNAPIGNAGAMGQQLLNNTRGAGVPVNPNVQTASFGVVPQRSSTRSPGIDKSGRRMSTLELGLELARRRNQSAARR